MAGDGLLAPLNAPPAAAQSVGIQPGTSRTIVVANAVVVFGATGAPVGVFVYQVGTIPGPGNPPQLAMTNQTADPFGNTVAPLGGITAGQYPNVQLSLQAIGGSGELAFLLNNASFTNDGRLEAGIIGAFAQEVLISPANTAAGFVDRVALSLNSSDGAASFANMTLDYLDNSGTAHQYASVDGSGATLSAAKSVIATEPGTGTSHATPAAGETWHAATLLNSWTASSGVAGVLYRMLPAGDGLVEVIGDVVNATATGNSICAQLPSGWRPSVQSNHPAAVNTGGTARATPWIFVDTSGNIQITGIVTANLETFFHIFVPMTLTK